jgi:hypothetical protein
MTATRVAGKDPENMITPLKPLIHPPTALFIRFSAAAVRVSTVHALGHTPWSGANE